jgi:hypothetical protein
MPTVACDGCGRLGLNLEGYHHSVSIPDYDLCDTCHFKQRHHLGGDSFQRVPAQQVPPERLHRPQAACVRLDDRGGTIRISMHHLAAGPHRTASKTNERVCLVGVPNGA